MILFLVHPKHLKLLVLIISICIFRISNLIFIDKQLDVSSYGRWRYIYAANEIFSKNWFILQELYFKIFLMFNRVTVYITKVSYIKNLLGLFRRKINLKYSVNDHQKWISIVEKLLFKWNEPKWSTNNYSRFCILQLENRTCIQIYSYCSKFKQICASYYFLNTWYCINCKEKRPVNATWKSNAPIQCRN